MPFVGLGVGVGRQRFGVGEAFSLFNAYRSRVESDGGVVEAFSCTIAGLRALL